LERHVFIRHLGCALYGLGACLVLALLGAHGYARFETYLAAQPRALVSTRVIWPEMPPRDILPSATPVPTPVGAPAPTRAVGITSPPVRIEIPTLGVERAIVPLRTVTRGTALEWDIESLFATATRRDLVGHLEGTANPGQPGNVVLAGHNYNRGAYNWTAVFYAISRLKAGDVIWLMNAQNARFRYEVVRVEQVPFQGRPDANTLQHVELFSPTADETLTLTTCGGPNVAPFSKRVYVVAKRKGE
jgi:sortase A